MRYLLKFIRLVLFDFDFTILYLKVNISTQSIIRRFSFLISHLHDCLFRVVSNIRIVLVPYTLSVVFPITQPRLVLESLKNEVESDGECKVNCHFFSVFYVYF